MVVQIERSPSRRGKTRDRAGLRRYLRCWPPKFTNGEGWVDLLGGGRGLHLAVVGEIRDGARRRYFADTNMYTEIVERRVALKLATVLLLSANRRANRGIGDTDDDAVDGVSANGRGVGRHSSATSYG